MSIIRQKRSDIAGRIPTTEQIQTGEIAINTHDGKMYFTRDKDGNVTVREVGLAERTDNVLYVSKTGSDTDNNGTTLAEAFATLNQALSVATPKTTIFLKSGDHYLDNTAGGIDVPEFVAIVGDNLRTTSIYPTVATNDMFYVRNGSHFTGVTFRGYEAPSAAISFNPDGSAGEIITSPYIQNCSSITGTGTGMRIDGNYASGLRSMVSDAYTNINFGGKGVHLLNRGYAQLVSMFTVSCEDGVLTESGGQCSLTNSNCSFGTYGLRSTGKSDVLYTATSVGLARTTTSTITLKEVTEKPKYGDAVKFNGIEKYHTVDGCTDLLVTEKTNATQYPPTPGSTEGGENASILLKANRDFIAESLIEYIEVNNPEAEYNIPKCKRDTKYIVDALTHDILYDGNFAIRTAAAAYFVGAIAQLPGDQVAPTIASYEYLKTLVGNILLNSEPDQVAGIPATATEVTIAEDLIDIIINVINEGNLDNLPALESVNLTNLNLDDYFTILGEKANLQTSVINYLDATYTELVYDQAKCSRDVGLIIDAITLDLILGTDHNSITAGAAYQRANAEYVLSDQRDFTIDAINYLLGEILGLTLVNPDTSDDISTSIGTINDLILNGDTATLTLLESLDQDIVDATSIEFFQRSLIVASSITFEYIGTGTEVFYNTPRTGAIPIQENEVVYDDDNSGQIYFTSTDHKGDFRIGNELLINRDAGIIEGIAFDRSLFAVMTPFILAIEG